MKTPGAAVSNEIINTLNQILELELAGVVKYTHYSEEAVQIDKWNEAQTRYRL